MTAAPGWFSEALAALSATRFQAFIADLWRARGRDVVIDGRAVIVRNGTEVRYLPLAANEHGPIPDCYDRVARAEPLDPRADPTIEEIGVDRIYELYRFGIDESDGTRLKRTYLQPYADQLGEGPSGSGTSAADDTVNESQPTDRIEPTRRSIVVGLGGALVGLGAGAALGSFSGDRRDQTSQPPVDSTPSGPLSGRPTPPGLSDDGIADIDHLIDAHTGLLSNFSYTFSISRTSFGPAGDLHSSLGLHAQLGAEGKFAVDVATDGPSGRSLFGNRSAQAQLWSDGERVFRRLTVSGETEYREFVVGAGVGGAFYWANVFPFEGRWVSTGDFLRWTLEHPDVSVVADGSSHDPVTLLGSDERVGSPPGRSTEVSQVLVKRLHASVSNAGLVRSLQLALREEHENTPRTVTQSIRYRDVGSTSIKRPAWLDRFLVDEVLI
ncbi:MAG: hypothetical protein ABEH64_10320 [Salinirussus sp.]